MGQDKIQKFRPEPKIEHDARMSWWREARFGLFIHWGLYAIPAGKWKGKTDHGEWIREQGEIPLEEYDKYVGQFNPIKFNANEWVRAAKDAGMKYIVITSKHHDGFCLFDSKETDFDVMSTPFKRDILKELSEACKREGIVLCFYYSIMDWHHPDYLPRREWETTRSSESAKYDRYVEHLKRQLKELVTNYGAIGVLWFDGEWETTWSSSYGMDLYNYVRGLQPSIIINNRVGAGRAGMQGLTKEGEFGGDFGTPEQEVPATGLPGVDWESCMTMNQHWGYNSRDDHWKSGPELIRMLVDVASKGGNLLLNIGPTAEGLFPPVSMDRLQEIGTWMKQNSEAIYGTKASPFRDLSWGRCTQKELRNGTRLYLHVFQWPKDGKIVVPGFQNNPKQAFLLGDVRKKPLIVTRLEDAVVIQVGPKQLDPTNTVVVVDVDGPPAIVEPPSIVSDHNIFLENIDVAFTTEMKNAEIRYTLDGSVPSSTSPISNSPVRLGESVTVIARLFRSGKPVSGVSRSTFTKVVGRPSDRVTDVMPGIRYAYFEGGWDWVPDFSLLKPVKQGNVANFDLSLRKEEERFGFEYQGYIRISRSGIYTFYTVSDDGSKLFIGDSLIVDNDGRHVMVERSGIIALAAGFHPIKVRFFERNGEQGLQVLYKGAGIEKQQIPDSVLFRPNNE